MNYIAFLFTAASIVGTLANSFQKKVVLLCMALH